MMDKSKVVDHIVLINEEQPDERLVFNFHTWLEVIKAILVHYAGKSESEAESLLFSSALVNNALGSYMAAVVRAHELEYHWAMELAHGEQYWQRGVSAEEPDGYFDWDEQYRKDHGLAEESFEFVE